MNGDSSVAGPSAEGKIEPPKVTEVQNEKASHSGGSLCPPPEDAWPNPVDGQGLLFDLLRILRRFVVIPPAAEISVVLWIVHTYVFQHASVSPILALVSPERRCGKTTLLALLEALVYRPLIASNITPAALFRAVELARPTLLVDELDTQLHRSSELRNLLNAGHLRSGRVIRADGAGRRPRAYAVYCPKAIARIGHLPSTLVDRSVVIEMNRRADTERPVEVFRHGKSADELVDVRRKLVRWAEDHGSQLAGAEPEQPESLHARAQDNWRILFAIADLCGDAWKTKSREAATQLLGRGQADPLGTMLLEDIREVISQRKGADRIPSSELAYALCQMQDRPWYDWPRAKGFSPHQLARLLRRYGIRPKVLWNAGFFESAPARGYLFAELNKAFDRYLKPLPTMKKRLPMHPDKDRLEGMRKSSRR